MDEKKGKPKKGLTDKRLVSPRVESKDLSSLIGSRMIEKSAGGLTPPKGKPDTPRRPPKKKEE